MSQVPDLRAQLRAAAAIDEPAGRALEVVAIIDEALGHVDPRPVVVGGMAVYFWTANDAFLTADIDVVIPTTQRFLDAVRSLGFERCPDGRHWALPGTEILVEAPGSQLDSDATVEFVEAPSGRTVSVLSYVDVLLDRLAEFQSTGHQEVGRQVLVLLTAIPPDARAVLAGRAELRRVSHALRRVGALVDGIAREMRSEPDSSEWHEIARSSEHAEYH